MAVFGRFSLRHLPLVERLTGRAERRGRPLVRPARAGRRAAWRRRRRLRVHPPDRRATRSTRTSARPSAPHPRRDRRASWPPSGGPASCSTSLELATHVAASAEPGDEAAAEILLEAGRAVAADARRWSSAEYHRRAVELLPAGSPRRGRGAGRAGPCAARRRPPGRGSRGRPATPSPRCAPGPAAAGARSPIVANDLYLGGRVEEALEVVDGELARGGDPCPLSACRSNLLFQGEPAGRGGRRGSEAARAAIDSASPAAAADGGGPPQSSTPTTSGEVERRRAACSTGSRCSAEHGSPTVATRRPRAGRVRRLAAGSGWPGSTTPARRGAPAAARPGDAEHRRDVRGGPDRACT